MLGKLTKTSLTTIAEIVGTELGWSDAEREAQIDLTIKRLLKKNLVDLNTDEPGLVAVGPREDETESIPETELIPQPPSQDEPEPVA